MNSFVNNTQNKTGDDDIINQDFAEYMRIRCRMDEFNPDQINQCRNIYI